MNAHRAEIRIGWKLSGSVGDYADVGSGPWCPDNPVNRRALQIVMQAGNNRHGDHTHWIEQRRVVSDEAPVAP